MTDSQSLHLSSSHSSTVENGEVTAADTIAIVEFDTSDPSLGTARASISVDGDEIISEDQFSDDTSILVSNSTTASEPFPDSQPGDLLADSESAEELGLAIAQDVIEQVLHHLDPLLDLLPSSAAAEIVEDVVADIMDEVFDELPT